MQDIDQLDPTPEETPAPAPSPRAADWFWRPWYAKMTWALTLLYWVGLELMIAIPFDQLNIYLVNIMVLQIFVFNPITVVAVLGYGFLKAKLACGEWTTIATRPLQPPKSLIDPYTDSFDLRSSLKHLRHIGAIKD
ncbi:hypothetical protein [Sphingobium yanoikuyae]|uniref:Uncharacterized protein n=1 Tax=Sphingobium yanoikuyae TaxID=13690 RepID=A0A430BQ38_SPHYA|nr:hypothetical protein [Sphingobium yanoikuyae]RSU54836.1 hypothetical protein DAH51_19360 [Sphingobium yanoikuyae]